MTFACFVNIVKENSLRFIAAVLGVVLLLMQIIGCGGNGDSSVPKSVPKGESTMDTMTYYFGFIRRGAAWSPEVTPEIMELQERHLANINRLADSGHLVLAGPFIEQSDEEELAGVFVYKVKSLEEARGFNESDPAIQAGRLEVDLYPWLNTPNLAYDEPETMTTYFMAILSRGTKWTLGDMPVFDDLKNHFDSEGGSPGDKGRLVISGPFTAFDDETAPLAMMIFRSSSIEEAAQLARSTPGIEPEILNVKVLKWFGPEGLRD